MFRRAYQPLRQQQQQQQQTGSSVTGLYRVLQLITRLLMCCVCACDYALQHFKQLLSPKTKLVSLVHVSNVLGGVLDTSYVVEEAQKVGTHNAVTSMAHEIHERTSLSIVPVARLHAHMHPPMAHLSYRMCACVCVSVHAGRCQGLARLLPEPAQHASQCQVARGRLDCGQQS